VKYGRVLSIPRYSSSESLSALERCDGPPPCCSGLDSADDERERDGTEEEPGTEIDRATDRDRGFIYEGRAEAIIGDGEATTDDEVISGRSLRSFSLKILENNTIQKK
jgi:hypothetical protein